MVNKDKDNKKKDLTGFERKMELIIFLTHDHLGLP